MVVAATSGVGTGFVVVDTVVVVGEHVKGLLSKFLNNDSNFLILFSIPTHTFSPSSFFLVNPFELDFSCEFLQGVQGLDSLSKGL